MIKFASYLLLAVLMASTAFAGIKLPAGVFRMAQLDQAMDLAKKQKKPLFFVYSDDVPRISSNNPELLVDSLKAGADWAVPVFISLEEETLMPPNIAVNVAGGYLPLVFIASPETDKVFKVITPPVNPIESRDLKKHIRAEISASKQGIAAWFAVKPPQGPELPGDRKLRWPLPTRKSFEEGVFDRVADDRLFFRGRGDYLNSGVPLSDLNPATRRYLRYITGTAYPPGTPEKPAPMMRKWTTVKGFTFEAVFISLKDDNLTLRATSGNQIDWSLDSLSPESQALARQVAAGEPKKP